MYGYEKHCERYSRMTGRRARGKLLGWDVEAPGYKRKYATEVFGAIRWKSLGKNAQ